MMKIFTIIKDISNKKKILALIAILLTGLLIYKTVLSKKKASAYQTAKAEKGTILATVSESGNVVAGSQVSVSSPSTGVIEELYVKNGDIVVSGQNLFKVRSIATPEDKAAAYATYLSAVSSEKASEQTKISAQATLEKSRQSVLDASNTVNSMNNNINSGLVNPATKKPYTQEEMDSINSALTSARTTFSSDEKKFLNSDSSIAASKAQLSSAWLHYQSTQDSIVTAPVEGTVANLSISIGSNVISTTTSVQDSSDSTSDSSGSTSSTSGINSSTYASTTDSPVLIIGNFSNLIIQAAVNEVDITKIKTNQKATITLDAFPDMTYVGNVYSVDTVGTNSSGVITYNAYVSFISPPPVIRPGMTASLTIQTERHDNILKVPSNAVQTTNGQSFVRVLGKNNQISQVEVDTDLISDSETEITSGLSEGDTVVTSIVTQNQAGGQSGTSPFGTFGGRSGFGGGAVRINR